MTILLVPGRHGSRRTPTRGFPFSGCATKIPRAKSLKSPRNPRSAPPAEATDAEMEAFRASQAEFVERMEPAVEAAFNLKYPRVSFTEVSAKKP